MAFIIAIIYLRRRLFSCFRHFFFIDTVTQNTIHDDDDYFRYSGFRRRWRYTFATTAAEPCYAFCFIDAALFRH